MTTLKKLDAASGMYCSEGDDGHDPGWYFPTPYEDLEGPYDSPAKALVAQAEWCRQEGL